MSVENNIAKAEINKVAIVPAGVIAVIIDAVILFINLWYCNDYNYEDIYFLISVIIMIVLSFIIVGIDLLILNHTALALTNKRIFGKTGVINTKSMDSPINKINSVSVNQGFWGKILNYSTVSVSTSSGSFKFAYIKNADEFKEKTMEQIDEYENEKLKNQAAQLMGAMNNY